MYQRLENLFTQTSEQSVLKENGPLTEIYVDMEYLQDLRLGTLLHLIQVEKEMEYIQHKLPVYNQKTDYACGAYFPALKHSDEEIDALLQDPKAVDLICFKAPFTSTYYELNNILMMLHQHNRAASSKPVNIHLHINVDNLHYPKELLKELKRDYKKRFEFLEVTITKCKRYTLPLGEYLKKELLLIYNIEEFLKQDTPTSIAFVGEGSFFDKKVFSVPYINKSVVKDPDKYEIALESTRVNLDVYCDFAYVPSTIPQF